MVFSINIYNVKVYNESSFKPRSVKLVFPFVKDGIQFRKECQHELTATITEKLHEKRYPAGSGSYLLKFSRNTRTKCEICSRLTIKTPERCHWREPISYLALVFLFLTLNM